jgi:hypothetical protein
LDNKLRLFGGFTAGEGYAASRVAVKETVGFNFAPKCFDVYLFSPEFECSVGAGRNTGVGAAAGAFFSVKFRETIIFRGADGIKGTDVFADIIFDAALFVEADLGSMFD